MRGKKGKAKKMDLLAVCARGHQKVMLRDA
jgi:hypothetical protein